MNVFLMVFTALIRSILFELNAALIPYCVFTDRILLNAKLKSLTFQVLELFHLTLCLFLMSIDQFAVQQKNETIS